jgi:biotin carboxyl carrier protein
MKQYRITLEGQTFEVKVLDDPRRERVRVEVDGEVFTVGVESMPMAAEVRPGETSQITASSPPAPPSIPAGAELMDHAVVAPLPGVIKTIAVRPGQRVAPNDELVVIEAMKMDNIIRATRAGVIGALHVAEGRQVAYGEPMLDYAD